MKSKEGLEERLEFLFPDEAVRKEKRPEYDERPDIELRDQPDGVPRLLPDRDGVHPVVEG